MKTYADYNASSPIRAKVLAAMTQALNDCGNPSSIHWHGRNARVKIESARSEIATYFNISPNQIIFTSGATEAIQIAIDAAIENGVRKIFLSQIEHDAVFQYVNSRNIEVQILEVSKNGEIEAVFLESKLSEYGKNDFLVCAQAVNSETGIIQNLAKINAIIRNFGGQFLVDAAQALGKIENKKYSNLADYLIVSSHKAGGPMGVGALLLASGIEGSYSRPGGGQERGFRAGTPNVAAIYGFGETIKEIASGFSSEIQRIRQIRDSFENYLKVNFQDLKIIGEDANRAPNVSCFAIAGWPREQAVIALDLLGVSISSGSACSSGSVKASRVLSAMGFDDTITNSVLRVSFGFASTLEDAKIIIEALKQAQVLARKSAA